jgi:hypothetical protein
MQGLKNVRQRRDDALSRVGWNDFEALLASYYRGQGYRVEHVGTGGTGARFDGGIDLKLRKDDAYIIVQCKHWNAKQVPHNDVHQLLGVMVNEGATGAILVSSGEFTAAARQAAQRQGHVQLVDGVALRVMLGPLPEPNRAVSDTGRDTAVAAIADAVRERLLGAVEDRIRGKQVVRPLAQLVLYKTMLTLAFGMFMLLMVWLLFHTAVGALQRTGQPAATVRAMPSPVAAPAATAVMSVPAPATVIEAAPVQPPAYRPPTEAEIRESQRKAEEAMKVIEATTPEV